MPQHIILVGGGLANGLIAVRLLQRRPDLAVTILERSSAIGGNHTWSFHANDLEPEARRWMEPFVVQRWPSQSVRFRSHQRELKAMYCTVSSERFRDRVLSAIAAAPRGRIHHACDVVAVEPMQVTLRSGETIAGTAVIDGRGFPQEHGLSLGWQKFHGIEIRTRAPHGLRAPILMDARVPQLDGFRFIYSLPLSRDRLLIEDTRYSDTPDLNAAAYHELLETYAAAQGWPIAEVIRSETGVLPVALGGNLERFFEGRGDVALSGLAAGLFHPTTGYSLPDAVRMADTVAGIDDLSPGALSSRMREISLSTWRRRGYFRMLNRMLFKAAQPAERHKVFERFYQLDAGLIERFYADRLTAFDKLRILTGKPPVPVGRAIGAIMRAVPPTLHVHGALKR